MKPPRTSRWRCSACSNWYPYPYPGPLRIDLATPPWVCHYCTRSDTDAIARRLVESVWISR
jgi:hypothetical protein